MLLQDDSAQLAVYFIKHGHQCRWYKNCSATSVACRVLVKFSTSNHLTSVETSLVEITRAQRWGPLLRLGAVMLPSARFRIMGCARLRAFSLAAASSCLHGWVRHVRHHKDSTFIDLAIDGSINAAKVVVPRAVYEAHGPIRRGSSLVVNASPSDSKGSSFVCSSFESVGECRSDVHGPWLPAGVSHPAHCAN